MITLNFSVDDQLLTRTDENTVAANSHLVHVCEFAFSSEWDGRGKVATFKKRDLMLSVILENDSCVIPPEILQSENKIDVFELSVCGADGNSTITSTVVKVPILAGTWDVMSTEITPTMFEQIMAKIEEIEEGQIDPESIEAAIDEYLRENPDAIINPTEVYNAITRSRLINLIPKYTDYRDGLEKTDAAAGANYYVLAPGHMGNQEDRFEYGPIVITVMAPRALRTSAPGASRASVYYLIQRAGYLPAGKYKLKNAWQTNDPNISIIYGYNAEGAEHRLAEVTTTNEIAEFEITQEIIDAGYDQILYIKLSEGAVGGEYFPLLTYGDVTDFVNVPEGYVDNNEELTKATLSLKADTDDLKDRVTELEEHGTGATPVISAAATVDNTTGTPAVNVTKTGTDAAPEFTFAFTGLKGAQGNPGTPGTPGQDGKSAYQIAVDNGFSGTEQEWLESLNADIYDAVLGVNRKDYVAAYAWKYGNGTITNNTDYSCDVVPADPNYACGVIFSVSINTANDNRLKFHLSNFDPTATSVVVSIMAHYGGSYALLEAPTVTITNGEADIDYVLTAEYIAEHNLTDIFSVGALLKGYSYKVSLVNTTASDMKIEDLVEDVERLELPLKNKKVIFLGDSITAFTGRTSWVDRFIEYTEVNKVANVAVPGAVLTDFSDTVLDGNPTTNSHNNTLPNQVQKIINQNYAAPDLIIIAIGANGGITATDQEISQSYIDANNTIVALADLDRQTAAGAFRYCNEKLHNLYPNAVICWCNPIHAALAVRPVANTVSWCDTLKKLTAFGSVNNIETERCGIFAANEVSGANGEYLADGLHPNEYGAKLMARYNAGAITNLYN